MIALDITPEALSYIMEHGGTATVDFAAVGGCCCPLFVPVVKTGEPPEPASYLKMRVPPATVFLTGDALVEEGGASITLTSGQVRPRLEIKGIYHRSTAKGALLDG